MNELWTASAELERLGGRLPSSPPPRTLGDAPRVDLGSEVLAAWESGQIWLAFQPIVERYAGTDAWRGCVRSAEVLLRWNHPKLGPLPPSRFIPVLEQSGLIHTIGDRVLRRACFQARRWLDAGFGLRQFSVNVSPSQIHDPGFSSKVRRALADSGLEAPLLALEVTEDRLVDNTEQTIECLLALTRLGVGLHIDDFGTGFSSIAYLKRLPLTAVKVERGFVRGIEHDRRDRELVRWMIDLGKIFGLEIIAEGVESESVARLLVEMGATRLQGFLYGHGVSAAEFERLHLRTPLALP